MMNSDNIINDRAGLHTLQVIEKAGKFNYWMYSQIKPFLKGEILEIGSGIGNISRFAINDKLSITLSDISKEYQQSLSRNFSGMTNVKDIISLDLQHPDFTTQYSHLKEQFDSIFLLNVIEHLSNDVSAIKNCSFLLKEKGVLIILAPAYPFLFCRFDRELGHYRRYTIKQLVAIFPRDSFNIIKQQYFNFMGLPGWLFFGKILGKKLIGAKEMSAFNNLVPVFKIADAITFKKIGLSAIVIGQKMRQ